MIRLSWTEFKNTIDNRNLSIQWLDANGNYYLKGYDGNFGIECILNKTINTDEVQDFETNYKSLGNQSPKTQVITQFELNNKDLKVACGQASVDAITKTATVYIKTPGTFGGANEGRYVAGGEAYVEDFEWGDLGKVWIEDKDRLLAVVYGEQLGLGRSATDGEMQASSPYTNYPIVKSYTDDELSASNQDGWFFKPLALGSTLVPCGFIKIEPIGGYGFIPAGMYLKVELNRPTKITGTIRVNIYWGKLE